MNEMFVDLLSDRLHTFLYCTLFLLFFPVSFVQSPVFPLRYFPYIPPTLSSTTIFFLFFFPILSNALFPFALIPTSPSHCLLFSPAPPLLYLLIPPPSPPLPLAYLSLPPYLPFLCNVPAHTTAEEDIKDSLVCTMNSSRLTSECQQLYY